MDAGRDLDALIAEKIMGFRAGPLGWEDGPHMQQTIYSYSNWSPSRDIAAAWLVVEHIRAKTHLVAFSLYSPTEESDKWYAGFEKKYHGRNMENVYDLEFGDSAPLAICLAALAALKAMDKSHT